MTIQVSRYVFSVIVVFHSLLTVKFLSFVTFASRSETGILHIKRVPSSVFSSPTAIDYLIFMVSV
uniref:Uncharacterized protein n=1 Tax=Salix viminalis TaxID=40686 RepID=A0A6N2LRD6_SALVM